MLRTITLVILLLTSTAQAEPFAIHFGGFSTHLNGEDYDYNTSHRLLAAEYRQAVVGYFRNSFDEDTFLAAYQFRHQWKDLQLGLMAGGSYGYRKCDKSTPTTGARRVCPVLAPSATYTRYELQPSVTLFGPALVFSLRYEL